MEQGQRRRKGDEMRVCFQRIEIFNPIAKERYL
jgi:hypothetical protein